MGIQISDFVDVTEKVKALGCRVPTGLAILPRNFETAAAKSELRHESEMPTVRTLWRTAGVMETPIEAMGERFPQITEKDFRGWVGPIILVTYAWLSQNPTALALALGVISNYLTDWFKGLPKSDRTATLEIVVGASDGSYKKLHYEGPAEGIDGLPEVVREVALGERKSGRVPG